MERKEESLLETLKRLEEIHKKLMNDKRGEKMRAVFRYILEVYDDGESQSYIALSCDDVSATEAVSLSEELHHHAIHGHAALLPIANPYKAKHTEDK